MRVFEGRFGKLVLRDFKLRDAIDAGGDPAIVLAAGDGEIRFLNPGEIHINLDETRGLVFHPNARFAPRGTSVDVRSR